MASEGGWRQGYLPAPPEAGAGRLGREEGGGLCTAGATAAYRGVTSWLPRSAASFVLIFHLYPADMIPIVSHQPWRLDGLVQTSPEDGGSGCRAQREERGEGEEGKEGEAGLEG